MDEAALLDARDDLHLDPASRSARPRKSPWFSASRTALVATARTGAPKLSAIRRQRASAATPRSIASSSRRVMSPEPVPSRTISFSRVSTSKWSSSPSRATTRCTELVPTSTAARAPGTTTQRTAAEATSRSSICDGTRIAEGGPEEPATKVETSTAAEAPYKASGDAK